MPSGIYDRTITDPQIRFWSKVEKTDYCWNWRGHKNAYGYGDFKINEKHLQAHRFSYELIKGKIPEGLQLDHLCRNRSCVNPDHLEAVTSKVNLLRGKGLTSQNARKTHCIHGHEFTPENTYFQKRSNGVVSRLCKACLRQHNRRQNQNNSFNLKFQG